MKLKELGDIYSGHITRGSIKADPDGSHYLIQVRDVDAERLACRTEALIRFHPAMTRADRLLEKGDLLFLAKGARNITIHIDEAPQPMLAAAAFFIVRLTTFELLPEFVCWYLNQSPVAHFLVQHSGRGVQIPVVRRAVLENIDVPVPPLDLQSRIAEMNALLVREIELLQELRRKRREMVTAVCLEAIQKRCATE